MLFLINPPERTPRRRGRKLAGAALAAHRRKAARKGKKGSRKRATTRVRLDAGPSARYDHRNAQSNIGTASHSTRAKAKRIPSMAARRRRRRRKTASAAPRRRRRHAKRRRAIVRSVAAPRRRRRRRHHAAYAMNPRRRRHTRRRYKRNPNLGGVTKMVVEGVKDGATVFVAQVATRKIGAGLNGMIPATVGASSPAVRGILTRLGGAIAVSMIARKVAPARARLAMAGAFAEVVNFAVAQNPTASSFLSAFPSRRVIPAGGGGRRVAAWPQAAAVSAGRKMGAYPMRSVGLPVGVGN